MQHNYCKTHSVQKNIVILLEIISSQEPSMMIFYVDVAQIPYPPRVFDRFQCSPDNDIIYESIEVKALCKSKMDSTSLKWSTYKAQKRSHMWEWIRANFDLHFNVGVKRINQRDECNKLIFSSRAKIRWASQILNRWIQPYI